MDPLATASAFFDRSVRKLVLLGLVAGALVGGWLWLDREPTPPRGSRRRIRAGRSRPPTAGRRASTMRAAAAT